MLRFNFIARDIKGKRVKGSVEARNNKEAIIVLKKKELIILDISPQQENFFSRFSSLFKKVSFTQIVGFTRQLATMVSAGLPLVDALSLIKDQSEGKLSKLIESISEEIMAGSSFSKALEKYEKVFGDVYVASIEAGEQAGVLEKVLTRLADNLEKKKEFTGKVKSAMIYPIIVVTGMIGVMFIVMVFVMPKMTSLYSDFGSDLPITTKILMGISDIASKFFWVVPFFGVIGILVYKSMMQTQSFREKIDRKKLTLPIIGPLNRVTILTEMTRTLAMLIQTGVPLIDAINIIAMASGNEVYLKSLEKASKRVEKGLPFSESIAEEEAFPTIVSQMIMTGEETGKLDEVLFNLSRYFEVESEQKVKSLTSAIEPLIMIVLGVGVGFLVFSVITPIYNLTSQF